jgi:hypothetical protein
MWVLFLVFNRYSRKALMFSIVLSAITLVSSILGLIRVVFDELQMFGIEFFAIPFMTPFFGLYAICGTYTMTYCAGVALSATWLGVGILLRQRNLSVDKLT